MAKEKSKILVLDDDPVIILSCKRILGAEGYSISTAEKGEDALNKLAKENKKMGSDLNIEILDMIW